MKNKLIMLSMIISLIISSQSTAFGDSFDPNLRIVSVISDDELVAGSSVNVTLYLKNDGLFSAKEVNLTLESAIEGLVATNTLSTTRIVEFKSKDVMTIDYEFKIDMNLEPGVYPVTLSGDYLNQQSEMMVYQEVFYLEILSNEFLNNLSVSTNTQKLLSDETNDLSILLGNNSQEALSDLVVTIEQLPMGLSMENSKLVNQLTLESLENQEISTNIFVSKEVATGYYTMDMVIGYEIGDKSYNEKKTLTLWVEATKEEDLKALSILSMSLSDSSLSENQSTTLTCVIKNISNQVIEDVIIEASQDVNLILTTQTKFLVDSIAPDESVTMNFTYKATGSSIEGNIPIEVIATYDNEMKTVKAFSGVFVDTKEDEEDDEDKVITKPRILVDSYELSKETIYVGDLFDLTLNIMNTNEEKVVSNLKMTMTTSDGMGITTDLLPVNQSQSRFIGVLKQETMTSITIPFEVLSTATGQIYTLDMIFEYEDKDGILYTDTDQINLPIYQLGDITISDVRLGKILDNGYKLELDFYNTGKVNINNLMVDIEGDFEPLNSNYFVGDFITGRMDVYDVQMQGEAPEWIEGTVIMTYDDTFGKEIRLEIPFSIENVHYGKADLEALESEGEMNPEGEMGFLGILIPLLILGVIIAVVVVLVRKKRRANEVL